MEGELHRSNNDKHRKPRERWRTVMEKRPQRTGEEQTVLMSERKDETDGDKDILCVCIHYSDHRVRTVLPMKHI